MVMYICEDEKYEEILDYIVSISPQFPSSKKYINR